jgi:hypothetical protein
MKDPPDNLNGRVLEHQQKYRTQTKWKKFNSWYSEFAKVKKHPGPTPNATFYYTEKYVLNRLERGKFELLKG